MEKTCAQEGEGEEKSLTRVKIKLSFVLIIYHFNPLTPRGSPLTSKIVWH